MARQGKRFEPTGEQRRQVETLAGFGIPHESIAKHIGIAPMTLTKHFKVELASGVIKANSAVVANLFRLASKTNSAVAAMFWCKTRMGWRERDKLDTDEARQALPQIVVHVDPKPAK